MKQYKDNGVRYMPDSRDQVDQTTRAFVSKLAVAFHNRIAMLKRK